MNYYIQGDATKADQIKAAFEAKAIYRNLTFANENYLYYSCDGKVDFCFIGGGLANIIKTHPDYKELKLHVEPEFKVGDWIANDYCAGKVIALTDDAYLLDSGQGIPFSCEHNAHLWTIQDAKDGDVLVDEYTDTIGIFEDTNEIYWHSKIYCGKSTHTKVYHHGGSHHIKLTKPATKEQRDLLFAKIKEAGYQWDADKKELRKIQHHYDISNFYAGLPVLQRSGNDEQWDYNIFSRYLDNNYTHPFILVGCHSKQCIPFEGNEKLLGTTDMCPEEFINW